MGFWEVVGAVMVAKAIILVIEAIVGGFTTGFMNTFRDQFEKEKAKIINARKDES